jgi:hypothetical protein
MMTKSMIGSIARTWSKRCNTSSPSSNNMVCWLCFSFGSKWIASPHYSDSTGSGGSGPKPSSDHWNYHCGHWRNRNCRSLSVLVWSEIRAALPRTPLQGFLFAGFLCSANSGGVCKGGSLVACSDEIYSGAFAYIGGNGRCHQDVRVHLSIA